MKPNNYNTGKYAGHVERVKRAQVAGIASKRASPWSKSHMVCSKSPRPGFVPRETRTK